MPIIEAEGLRKTFRQPDKKPGFAGALRHLFARSYTEKVAVDDLDLSIEPGEALAYVGPNGAGKSTTVKLLTGILEPTGGRVRVGGIDPHRDREANARQIGVLFGQRTQLWWDIPVGESLAILRDVYGVDRAVHARRLAELDDVLELGPLLPVVARRLSLGQRMRADLAATFLHAPAVVYLDEPTIGLDIEVKDRVRVFLRRQREAGTTVLLTTHDLRDIEDVCGRLAIIDEGRLIYDGDLAGAKDEFARQRRLRVVTQAPVPPDALASRVPTATVRTGADDRELVVEFDRFTASAVQVLAAVSEVAAVLDISVDEPAIEDVVRRVYARQAGTVSAHAGS